MTYKLINSVKTALDILKFVAEQDKPVSGKEVSRAIGKPYGTIMCYIETMESERFINKVNSNYELGLEAAMLWGHVKKRLKTEISNKENQLKKLEGE